MATRAATPAAPVRLQASFRPVDRSVFLMLTAFVLVPASFVPLAIGHGGALIVVPYQHFYIVSAISLLAAVVAGALGADHDPDRPLPRPLHVPWLHVDGGDLRRPRADHAGHPGPQPLREVCGKRGRGVRVLSLAVPAVFFAAAYAPGMSRLERRLPFWPAGWLVLFVTVGLVAYGAIAVKTWILAQLPLSIPPYSTALAIGSILLFFLAAVRQAAGLPA